MRTASRRAKVMLCAVLAAAVLASCGGGKKKSSGGSSGLLGGLGGGVSVSDLAPLEKEAFAARHVAEVTALRGDSNAGLEALTAKIVQVLSARPDLRIVDRTKMDDVMAEIAFQQSDWAEETAATTVGNAIAADMRVVLTASGADSIKVDFLDVNTLQTVTAVVTASSVGSLSSLSFEAFDAAGGSKDFSLNGTWYCNGVRKSQQSYGSGDLEKITPFGRLRPEKAERDEYSDMLGRKLRSLDKMIVQDETLVTFITGDGDEIYADASFSPKEPFTATSGGKEYSTLLVGKIRIREDGGAKLLEGDVFADDGALAIHFGSQNGDGTGAAYFLMFEE